MLLYYGLVAIADLLFGSQFLTKRQYVKKMGSGLFATMFLTCLGGVLSGIIMLCLNGGKFEFTPFTMIMVLVRYVNSLVFMVCSLKSFERVNLATYSVYAMLGGMILPIIAGVFFYHEEFTVGLLLCILLIGAAIYLTNLKKRVKKEEKQEENGETTAIEENAEKKNKKGKWIAALIYAGVFCSNGMAGVITKFYAEAPWEKASNAGFSLLGAIWTVAYSAIMVAILWKKRPPIQIKPTLVALCGNAGNRIANHFLLIALAVLPATTNYSLVTGGTMIVSTVLSYFTDKKPTLADWAAVICSFVGIVLMLALPYTLFII